MDYPFYSTGNHHHNPQQMAGPSEQLTLTQLNSPTDANDYAAGQGAAAGTSTTVKMETNDFDDLDLFLTNSSPNVSITSSANFVNFKVSNSDHINALFKSRLPRLLFVST